jgi:hypothetical protein
MPAANLADRTGKPAATTQHRAPIYSAYDCCMISSNFSKQSLVVKGISFIQIVFNRSDDVRYRSLGRFNKEGCLREHGFIFKIQTSSIAARRGTQLSQEGRREQYSPEEPSEVSLIPRFLTLLGRGFFSLLSRARQISTKGRLQTLPRQLGRLRSTFCDYHHHHQYTAR